MVLSFEQRQEVRAARDAAKRVAMNAHRMPLVYQGPWCTAASLNGRPCRNRARAGIGFCGVHMHAHHELVV